MENSTIFASIPPFVLVLVLLKWRLAKRRTEYGAACWLPAWSAQGAGLFRGEGLLIGDWTGRLPVYYNGGGHALTVAPTGMGKGTCAIIPNLLRHPWLFVVDPGGENTAVAIAAWRRKNYEVVCLNPWRKHDAAPWSLPSDQLNPVAILDPKSPSFVSDADLLAEMIVTRSGRESGNSSFFKDEAQSGLRAMLLHIATAEPPARRNLLTLRQYITADATAWEQLVAAMRANQAAGGLIAREAAQFERREAQAGEEFSAILSTMKQDTNFIEDPVMQEALGGERADLSALKGCSKDGRKIAGCAVAIVIPLEYIETHAAYARLVTAVALWTMQRGALARGRVLFLLDEFPALGPMKRIASGLATLRKYRVWLWPIVQNLGQLKNLYGANWQTFISNAGLLQFIGAGDIETAGYISTYCGEATIEVVTKNRGGASRSLARRQLAMTDEIMCLKDDLQIVSIGNMRPLLLKKTPYWERPGIGGYNRNPYVERGAEISLLAPLAAAWGKAVHLAAWTMRPASSLVVVAVMLAFFALRPGILIGDEWRHEDRMSVCFYATTSGMYATYTSRLRRPASCAPIYLSLFHPVIEQ
ncbi:MAG: type IV secretory system conjugative DNA transfer family protein [Xanthobacteraceae bacterium]